MKKAIALILSLSLILACAVSFADPVTLHVEKGNYTLDLSILDVRIEGENLIVDCSVENNDSWDFSNQPPLIYALNSGKKYEAETYSATLSGSSIGGMILAGASYTIPYGPSELPEELYAESGPGKYELVWTIADAALEAPAEEPGAAAEGSESVEVPDDDQMLTLTIQEYGFSGEDHTNYHVTVGGYNLFNSGKSGVIEDIMPFELAIAWSRDDYLTHEGYVIRFGGGDETEGSFSKDDNSAMEEPLYIIIAPKGTEVRDGFFYVISEGMFYPADAVQFE